MNTGKTRSFQNTEKQGELRKSLVFFRKYQEKEKASKKAGEHQKKVESRKNEERQSMCEAERLNKMIYIKKNFYIEIFKFSFILYVYHHLYFHFQESLQIFSHMQRSFQLSS